MEMNKFFIVSAALALSCGILAAGKEAKPVEPFDRGIAKPSTVFIPSGTSGGGFTFSFTNYKLGDQFEGDIGFSIPTGLVNGLKGSYNTFKIAPSYEYFLWDNNAITARISYGRTLLDVGNANLSISDDLSFSVGDYSYSSNSISASLGLKNYMPIGNSKRFAMIIEGRLTGGYSQNKSYKLEEGLKHGTYSDVYSASFDFVPGLCVFVMNNVAVTAQMGVFGISLRKSVQTENQVGKSSLHGGNTSFGLNVLSVEVGTSFYILDRKHRPSK